MVDLLWHVFLKILESAKYIYKNKLWVKSESFTAPVTLTES